MDIRSYIFEQFPTLPEPSEELQERIRKVRIKRSLYRQRKLKYKRNKRKLLAKARRRRRSAQYKRTLRKYKIKSRRSSYVKRKFLR